LLANTTGGSIVEQLSAIFPHVNKYLTHHITLYNMIYFKAMLIFSSKINKKLQLNYFTYNFICPIWLVNFTQIELNKYK